TLRVAVLGAGEMARLSAVHFAGHVDGLVVTARTRARAETLAQEVGATVEEWTARAAVLADADIVIAATGAGGLVIEAADMAAAPAGGRRRGVRPGRSRRVDGLAAVARRRPHCRRPSPAFRADPPGRARAPRAQARHRRSRGAPPRGRHDAADRGVSCAGAH